MPRPTNTLIAHIMSKKYNYAVLAGVLITGRVLCFRIDSKLGQVSRCRMVSIIIVQ